MYVLTQFYKFNGQSLLILFISIILLMNILLGKKKQMVQKDYDVDKNVEEKMIE